MMKKIGLGYGALALLSLAATWAPQQQDVAKERLRVALKDYQLVGPWVYDDIQKGFAEAHRADKPLMVIFR